MVCAHGSAALLDDNRTDIRQELAARLNSLSQFCFCQTQQRVFSLACRRWQFCDQYAQETPSVMTCLPFVGVKGSVCRQFKVAVPVRIYDGQPFKAALTALTSSSTVTAPSELVSQAGQAETG